MEAYAAHLSGDFSVDKLYHAAQLGNALLEAAGNVTAQRIARGKCFIILDLVEDPPASPSSFQSPSLSPSGVPR